MAKRSASSQKLLPRKPQNPRGYPVERDGVTHYVELPWITGVMADLSGVNAHDLPDLCDRTFEEVNTNNFNDYLKSQRPRVRFTVENMISGASEIEVDLTFANLSDFSPEVVARRVDSKTEVLTIVRETSQGQVEYRVEQEGPVSIALGESFDSLEQITDRGFVARVIGADPDDIEIEWLQDPEDSALSTLHVTRRGPIAKLLDTRNRLKDLLDGVKNNSEAMAELERLLGNRELLGQIANQEPRAKSCTEGR